MKNIHGLLLVGCSALALAGCGPSDIASPSTGGNVIIENPTPTPSPGPTPTPTGGTVTPASGCPTIADPQGLSDQGVLPTPQGAWRVCRLPARINTSITLPKLSGLLYELGGRVDVGTDGGAVASSSDTNVTLTIEPGVIIFGGTGVAWLHVNRGNKINATGTASAPIIFTSRDNVLGLNDDNDQGQWGGVVLSGRAQITDCFAPGATPGEVGCERQTEGAVDLARYGGTDNAYNAGTMKYVQIRYSGYVLSGNSELQALTLQGVGTGTTLEYIQSVNSSDDSMEIFGGHVNMKHYIAVGADDDMIDTDTGAKVNLQYLIAVQRQGAGDSLIEADSDNALDGNTPRQNTQIANFTFVANQSNSNGVAMLLRGGTDYAMVNGVVVAPTLPCLRISRAQTASPTVDPAIDELGVPRFHSVVMQCNSAKYLPSADGTPSVATTSGIFNVSGGNNRDDFTPTLTSVFINGASESAIPAYDPKLLVANNAANFFDTTTWIGAVRDAADTWYTGWTCNTAAANFGSGNSGNCTTLPTT